MLAPAGFFDEAEAEEAEGGFVEDGGGDAEAGADEHGGDAVGQHVAEEDRRRAAGRGAMAACTKSWLRRRRNSARTKRASPVQLVRPMMAIIM